MTPPSPYRWSFVAPALAGLTLLCLRPARAGDLDTRLQAAEAKRVAVIEKVKPAVVAVFANGGAGGGSGVLIDPQGFALTNFHVVAPTGPVMKCGLADGILYDAVLVGLDRVGDVALIKLLPKKEGDKFPFAPLGDSDKVQAGDWSLAMGNPFLLATDFTPTVTFGLVSGVHRYQYPEGGLLEYTDCIQIDTSINPGNSGGPLFNMDAELIGINGRGSFDKRMRINSGVGYAISINQIKNFMGQLRAGMDTDHASLGAIVETESEEGDLSKMIVKGIIDSDARRRGLDTGDQLVAFAGRPMTSVNQFKNVLGLYPRGWRLPLTYRRDNEKHEILVRLMGVIRQEVPGSQTQPQPQPEPQPPNPRQPPSIPPRQTGPRPPAAPDGPAAKLYEARAGFANFYFNKLEREKLLSGFRKHGDFGGLKGTWTLKTSGTIKGKRAAALVTIKDQGSGDSKTDLVQAVIDGIDYGLEPLKAEQPPGALRDPPGSGGLLLALYQYRQLLAFGEKGFVGEFSHGGIEPFYPPGPEKDRPDYTKLRIDAPVLRTRHAGIPCKWYFDPRDQTLLGFEVQVEPDEDPCEVYLADYRPVDGRQLPHRLEVRFADKVYAVLNVTGYKLDPAK